MKQSRQQTYVIDCLLQPACQSLFVTSTAAVVHTAPQSVHAQLSISTWFVLETTTYSAGSMQQLVSQWVCGVLYPTYPPQTHTHTHVLMVADERCTPTSMLHSATWPSPSFYCHLDNSQLHQSRVFLMSPSCCKCARRHLFVAAVAAAAADMN